MTPTRNHPIGRPLLAAVLAASLAGCRHAPPAASEDAPAGKAAPIPVEMGRATRMDISVVVTAQGTLTPGQGASARLAAASPGRLATVLVREGDAVAAGQVVATVDNRSQRAQAASAAAAVSSAQAQAASAGITAQAAQSDQQSAVRVARLSLTAAEQDMRATIQLNRNALQSSQTDLRRIRAGARPQERTQAEIAVNQAETSRSRAVADRDRTRRLVDIGVASRQQLEATQTAVDLAEAALANAKEQRSLVAAGARPEELRAAELRVEASRQALAQSRASGEAKVAQARAALRQAEAGVLTVAAKQRDAYAMRQTAVQKRADLTTAQTAAQIAVLRAPISGKVVHRFLNPGDTADPASPVLEIANLRSLNMVANVPAEEAASIHAGQSAQVTSSDAPGRPAGARVVNVGEIDPQTNLAAVRIQVASSGSLRSGAFATARIVTRVDRGAVAVPARAVVDREGKAVVFVITPDGLAHQHPVSAGVQQGSWAEIRSGLAGTERVVTVGQSGLTDGAAVKEAPARPAAKAAD